MSVGPKGIRFNSINQQFDLFLQLFQQQQLQNMSSSYYYPYFSARNVQPRFISCQEPSFSPLYRQSDLLEQQFTQRKMRQKQQMLLSERLKDYQLQLRIKRRLNETLNVAERDESTNIRRQKPIKQQQQNIQHFKELQNTKTQRKNIKKQRQKQNLDINKDVKRDMKKDYQQQIYNEKRIKEYQNELLRKINSYKESRHRDQNLKKEKKIEKKQVSNCYDVIINKKKKDNFTDSVIKNIKKQKKKKINDKDIHSFRRQLLSNYESLDCPPESRKRGQTIDFQNQTIRDKIRNKGSSRANQARYHSQRKKKSRSKLSFMAKKENLQPLSSKSSSLQRIQNRLKLSMIVFKDSKLKNLRYQIDHIVNTFDNEKKLRKQIKDRINNNPRVLKKQRLVVESR